MKPAREVKLKVAEAIQDDVNKGIVRIDTSYMNDIGIRPGDIIEIEGERKTVAIADRAYPGDIGLNIIRIDGIIRKNAKTGIGEFLIARKADVKEAKKISIAPARKGIIIRASTSIFKQGLLGRAVMKGDIVSLGGTRQRRSSLSDSPFFDDVFNILDESMMGFGFGDIKFIVADVLPKQAVIITDATEVIFNPEAVEVEDEELPEVSYEDIGGLEDEIKKIREMVELPLKHPEIFAQLGVEPPKGVLLHGPPGTGKTLLAKAVANETNSHFILINGPEIMSKYYGQSLPYEEKILVLINNELKWVPIGEIVENNTQNFKVPCFNAQGKVIPKEVSSLIKHKFRGKLARVTTESGRSITVTDDHSLFVFVNNKIVSIKTSQLEENISSIVVPKMFIEKENQLEEEIILETGQKLIQVGSQLLQTRVISEKVTKIDYLKNQPEFVYDISVPGAENFIAGFGGIFAHNSEENLRKKFEEAEKNAPSIVFIDEIDAIATKREETRGEVERRVVAQMLALMDGLQTRGKVVVIGATNVPNILDPALRRPGRFDREVEIGVPSKEGRLNILKIHTRNMPILPTFDEEIAKSVMDKFENRLTKEVKELESKIRTGEGNKQDHEQEIVKEKTRLANIAAGKPRIEELLAKNQQKVIEIDAKVMKQILDLLVKDIVLEIKKGTNKADLIESFDAFGADLVKKVYVETEDKDGRKKLIRNHLEEIGLDKVFIAELIDTEIADKIIDKTKDLAIKKRISGLLGVGLTEEEKQRKLWDTLKEIDTEVSDEVHAKSKEMMLKNIADITHGFVGADLASVAKESAMIVLRRILPDLRLNDEETIPQEMLEKLRIREKDLRDTLKFVRPSAMREVLVEVPNIKWADVGGLDDVKRELKEVVEWPIRYPEAFKRMGINPPKGVLLYGPPGVGKTMLAKAVANESQANFILVKGPELFSKWVGESEKAVRRIFEKARQTSPTIVFFDELDALAPMRGGGMSGDGNVTERVVNQLLTEIDGLEDLHDVVVIGATNRPDIIDTGLLRPGRFDRVILVTPPTEAERVRIFEVHTKTMPLDKDVKLKDLAKRTEGYVGSDIESVCREGAIFALRDDMKATKVGMAYFEKALKKVGPSVTKEVEETYKQFSTQFRQMKAKRMKAETNYMG